MPTHALPCCSSAEPKHLEELPHVYQFDFDLYQCAQCSRYWVSAWREGQGGWESTTAHDAEQMQSLKGAELTTFMKAWAQSFN